MVIGTSVISASELLMDRLGETGPGRGAAAPTRVQPKQLKAGVVH